MFAKMPALQPQFINPYPLDSRAAISQTTFPNAFSLMKKFHFWFKFHRNLFPMVQLTRTKRWYRKWLGAEKGTSHYPNQCWLDSLPHTCSTQGGGGGGVVKYNCMLFRRKSLFLLDIALAEPVRFDSCFTNVTWPPKVINWLSTYSERSLFDICNDRCILHNIKHRALCRMVWHFSGTRGCVLFN